MSAHVPARILTTSVAMLLFLSGCAASAPTAADGSDDGPGRTEADAPAPEITGPAFADVPTCEHLFFGGDDDPAGTFRSLLRDGVSDELVDQYLNETSNLCGDNVNIGQSVLFTMMSVGVTMNQLNVRFETATGDATVEGAVFPGEIDGWRLVHAEEMADFRSMFEHASSNERTACPAFSTNTAAVTTDGRVHGVYVDFSEAIAVHGCPMSSISISREPTPELAGMLTGADAQDVDGASCVVVAGVACGVTDGTTAWAGSSADADHLQKVAALVRAVAAAN